MAETGAIRAGLAYVELFTDNTLLIAGLNKAKAALTQFQTAFNAIGEQIGKLGTMFSDLGSWLLKLGLLMAAPFAAAVKSFTTTGTELELMAERTGASVEHLSALGYAVKKTGGDVESLGVALTRMQKSIGAAAEGGEAQIKAFKELGIAISDLNGKTVVDQFLLIADAAGKMASSSERAQALSGIFSRGGGSSGGSGWAALLPLFKLGADGIQKLMDQGVLLGHVWSNQDAVAAKAFRDALLDMWLTIKDVAREIGSALAPFLTKLAEQFQALVIPLVNWIKNHKEIIVAIATSIPAIIALGAGLLGLGKGLGYISSVLKGAGTVFGILKTGLGAIISLVPLLLNPIGLVVAAFVVGIGAVIYYTGIWEGTIEYLSDKFKAFKTTAIQTWKGIADALKSGDLVLAVKILWAGIKLEWARGVAALNSPWQKFKADFLIQWAVIKSQATSAINSIAFALERLLGPKAAADFKTRSNAIWTSFRVIGLASVEVMRGYLFRLMAMWDPKKFNVKDLEGQANKDDIADMTRIQTDYYTRIREIDKQSKESPEQMRLRYLKEEKKIQDELLKTVTEIINAKHNSLGSGEKNVELLKDQLRILTDQADMQARFAKDEHGIPHNPEPKDVFTPEKTDKILGTFSALGATLSFGGPQGGAAQQIARGVENIHEAVQKYPAMLQTIIAEMRDEVKAIKGVDDTIKHVRGGLAVA